MKKDRMIRNIYVMVVGLVAGACVTACSHEEDDIFDQSAAERLNAVGGVYSERLTQSHGGWVMEYYPYSDNEDLVTGTGYLIMNRFHDNGAVFTAMKNKASYNTFWTDSSSWQIVTYMGPVLTYNSYNRCFGRFSDPNDIDLTTARGEDESGKGFQGDYEFVMVDVPENAQHIMLKGVKRGVYQRLTRLPEGTDFETYLDDIDAFKAEKFMSSAKWELIMTDKNEKYRINWAPRGLATVYPAEKDSTTYGWHMPFLVTKLDDKYYLRWKDTLMIGTQQMEQEFVYVPEDDKFHGVLDANNTIEGGDPYEFFTSVLEKGGNRWEWNANSEMSDAFKTVYDGVVSDFNNILKYPLTNVSFRVNGKQLVLRLLYKQKSSNSNIDYIFEMTKADGKAVFKYVSDNNTAAKNAREKMPNVQALIDLLAQSWIPEASTSRYDLNTIKLTSDSDANTWFVATLK